MDDIDLQNLPSDVRSTYLALKCDIAELRLWLAYRNLIGLLPKANFSPAQLRIPAGEPGAGRWTNGGDGLVRVGARGRTSVRVRAGRGTMEATPAQATRLAIADAWARDAVARARAVDPTWRPRPSISESVEGEIAARQAEAREAEAHIAEVARTGIGGNNGPPLAPSGPQTGTGTPGAAQCIASYRAITGMPEPDFGLAGRRSDGTVAFADVDGKPVIGVNANAPGYTVADEIAANAMRTRLIEQYPSVMAVENIGNKPNDALYHAEATALLRAADANGGTLAGRVVDLSVDRRLCPSCDRVLPLIGQQLGNPTARITDGTGAVWIMRNGTWIARGRQ